MIENLIPNKKFIVLGALYYRCSGKTDFLSFNLLNIKRRSNETDKDFSERVSVEMNLEDYIVFPDKNFNLEKLRLYLEDMWINLKDPIRKCKAIKIRYLDDLIGYIIGFKLETMFFNFFISIIKQKKRTPNIGFS